MGNALLRGKRKIIHPVDGIKRGDGIHTQRINDPLDDQLPDRLGRLLHGRYGAVAENPVQHAPVKTQIRLAQMKQGHFAVNIHNAKQRRAGFGDIGPQSCPCHAPVQNGHK
ncbi:hypothetical protein D3C75_995910 [compost metagenome]